MTKRTEQERLQIADKCLEVEAEGGDVLAYLASEHYVTPRATWINIQKHILHRGPAELTDGHPTGKKTRRGRIPVNEAREAENEKRIQRELNTDNRDEAAKAPCEMKRTEQIYQEFRALMITNKKTPLDYLRSQGYGDSAYYMAFRFRERMKEEGFTFNNGVLVGKQKAGETEETDPEPVAEEKTDAQEPEAKQYRFVPLREIRLELTREYDRLIGEAYKAMTEAGDPEQIQNELYMVLTRLMSLNEVSNLGRRRLDQRSAG